MTCSERWRNPLKFRVEEDREKCEEKGDHF
jgi:hypothetical protein